MSGKKKCELSKPPVPARPENLIIFNSRNLPKPPETFSCENVRNFIKDLNLDLRDEENQQGKLRGQRFESSDGEEETFGYLEPVTLQLLNGEDTSERMNDHAQVRKLSPEDNSKFRDMLRKTMNKNNSNSLEVSESEETKASHPQWQRPLPSLPLPPVETKTLVATLPWYKNVDRKAGEEILRNGVNGYFLVRPSSNANTYLTLTLWYNNRVYNIPIRRRKDGKFALGTPKTHEQCFDSVECLVKNYQSEKLVLYSNGVQTGKTLLTTYPP